ncbi:hypothetical protein PAMP_017508 [Pampus punctatissimus]
MKTTEHPASGFPALESSSAEEARSFDESNDCLNQPKDYSPPTDMSSALRSVALMFKLENMRLTVPKLFTVPSPEEDDSTLSPLGDQDTSAEGSADPVKEEVMSISFHSKYIHIFPLYQDYCLQAVKDDLHRLDKSFVSELITPQYLQGLQSRLSPQCYSKTQSPQRSRQEATQSSPPPQFIRVTPCTLWQDLDELMFELIGSEASYLRSLGVTVDHFYASKPLKQNLSKMEHHILFSNIRHVKAASEKFLMDLEIRLGENIVICQIGDIVLKHCPAFHTLYVPYVTNMMYQEALVNQLLDQRFIVEDHAEFPTHVHIKHLKTEVLGLHPDSFLLHLSQSQTGQPTAMILVTHTRSDKEAWMKVLSSKQ